MELTLENVSSRHGAEIHIHPLSLALKPGSINVLLGPTQAGKTSLLRLMAGLDRPWSGRITAGGHDVTGVPVRRRDIAMVYQQFINYPSLTVFENIASPLRIRRLTEKQIQSRVAEMAERLHISPYLHRYPAELSGGQQQRTALARALVKEAGLLLLDEPLVNLDYKLREELRRELTELFSDGSTTVVYATTEPLEALQLGGHVAVIHEGRLLQAGPTIQVFHAPGSVQAARIFSDPPMNLITAEVDGAGNAHIESGLLLQLEARQMQKLAGQKKVTLGLRAHHLHLVSRQAGDLKIPATVDLAEISGSETFIHARRGSLKLVAQLSGVHELEIGAPCTLFCNPQDILLFSAEGTLLFAPEPTRRES